jgi:two-component system NtrC family sensor kinase
MLRRPGEARTDLWRPSRTLERTVIALLLTPIACLLLFALALLFWGHHRSASFFALLIAALALSAAVGWPIAARLRSQLSSIRKQRDALYQEILRLSKAAGLGEVASSIAHDLNNPLAIIREEAGWIRDLMAGEDPQGEHTREEITNSLQQIEAQIDRSRQITLRLLAWGRDTSSASEGVDVNLLLNKTLYLIESELQATNVNVKKAFASGDPRVWGSVPELRQVFLNIMKNAVDAMAPHGGTLTLATQLGPGEVHVTISDTGPGIPPAAIEHVFEPFFTTKPPGEGTGLGLPISKWIVEKLGGRIEIESAEGSGAAFHLRLPALDSNRTQPC